MGNKLGKSPGKKLQKRRTQSITWSFRFSTLRKHIMPQVVIKNSPHIAIERWLEQLSLSQYQDSFRNYKGVEELLSLSEADIKRLGVRNSAHRAHMVSSLVLLREKYMQAQDNAGNTNSLRPRPKPSPSHCRRPPSDPGTGYSRDIKNGNSPQDQRSIGAKSSITLTKNQENPSVYETLTVKVASDTKQSKSCGDLVDMDPGQGADIQEAVALKKALEWELSLDSRDLRSHAWYHGTIPRHRAEEIVQKDGDFLIRDCASQPGNYVLTCRTKASVLHFVINKILIQPETVYERVQYQFEDDAYDTVPDLITFYVGSGKAISAASGARIQYPCNRTYPLSYYNNKFGMPYNIQSPCSIRGASPLNSPSLSCGTLRFNSYAQPTNGNSFRSPMSSPPRTKRDIPPRLPSKKQRSHSLTPVQATISSSVQNVEKYCSADGVIQMADTMNVPSNVTETRRLVAAGNEKSCSADGVIQAQNGSRDMMIRSVEEKCTSADGVINSKKSNAQMMSRSTEDPASHLKFSSHSLPRPMSGNLRLASSRASSLNRDISDTSLSPCLEHTQFTESDSKAPSPPPKPSRLPAKRDCVRDFVADPLNRVASYHASGSDSGNGSGDSAQSSAAGDQLESMPHRGGVIIKNPRFMTTSASSMTLRSFNDFDVAAVEHILATMDIPIVEILSQFDLENSHTLLLPSIENKPLDNGALNTLRMMLAETGPRIIAQHLTRVDLYLFLGDFDKPSGILREEEEAPENQALDCMGLELLTLPQGGLFRKDLIERTQCLKFLVAVTILICQSDLERAETLSKWIQVAVDTKTALGNLYGFCAIMLGICMPQIQQLEKTWHILRQKFTDSAFTFEAKLRPTLKSMNDCSNPQAPNTTVPHVLPYILLRDRANENILLSSTNNQSPSLVASCINTWEQNADDFGISILFAHLDSARTFTKNLPLYKRNAQMVIDDSSPRLDELLLEAFKTEFHMKFLWGSKGALSPAQERHNKMEDLLTLMAKKFCSGDHISCTT